MHYRTNRLRKRAEKFARWRKRKEELRVERLACPEPAPDLSHCPKATAPASGFRITIECLDDGEQVSFVAARAPSGELSVSPSAVARRVKRVLQEYRSMQDLKSRKGWSQ